MCDVHGMSSAELVTLQMQAVEDDRRRLADKLNSAETAHQSMMSHKLRQLEAQLAAKDAQIQAQQQANAAR